MKLPAKFAFTAAAIIVTSGIAPASALSAPDVTVSHADGGSTTISQGQATAEHFPVLPSPGESATVHSPGKTVTVETSLAGCSMSYTANTPYKSVNNRVEAEIVIARGEECEGYSTEYAYLARTNYGGGQTTEGSDSVSLGPGSTTTWRVMTKTCTTGVNTTWQSSAGGSVSSQPNLPCQFF